MEKRERPHHKIVEDIDTLSSPFLRLAEKWLYKEWWLVLVFFLCLFTYEQGTYRYSQEEKLLTKRLNELSRKKDQLLKEKNLLEMQVNSQSDPAWIELTLMKKLGTMPEDQRKFYFTNHPE